MVTNDKMRSNRYAEALQAKRELEEYKRLLYEIVEARIERFEVATARYGSVAKYNVLKATNDDRRKELKKIRAETAKFRRTRG